MSIDYKKINEYFKLIDTVSKKLEDHQELFDSGKSIEIRQVTNTLRNNIEKAKNESRKLSIGVIGDVKAGKSSFLNACIFNGEDYLPKAATPMTAALTHITYSNVPKAIIHFYTDEDWGIIEKQSKLYDEGLNKAYEEYCKKIEDDNKKSAYAGVPHIINCISIQDFEKGYKCNSENQRGAKELTRMANKSPSLMDKLGGVDEIDGDIFTKLKEYVGANGAYTPIVSYVELQVDNQNVKDYEIVDTPGLNDPIISRGVKTRQFLRTCDVVVLLSPCSQFMPDSTVNLMAKALPEAGVNEVLIVGSKLDSGILNEDDRSFAQAYKKAITSYKSQFISNLEQVKSRGENIEILRKMSLDKVLFASAMCFSIDKKLKKKEPLDIYEKNVYENLCERFDDFDDKYIASIGGIGKVHNALNEIQNRNIEIIEEKNSNLLDITKNNHLRVIDSILQEIVSSRNKLETISAEELRKRSESIKETIDSSRVNLMHVFDNAIIKCEGKIQQIIPELTLEIVHHEKVRVDEKSRQEKVTFNEGLFGWKKREEFRTIYDKCVKVSDVISNIKTYSSKCQSYINSEFKNLFNKEEFQQTIKNIVINAFDKSQKEYDENEILLPLNNVLEKISIPHISFDYTPYIDEVCTRFKEGYAQNEEIHRLIKLQSELFDKIELEIIKKLVDELKNITDILRRQAVTFADQIENNLCGELDKLQGQVKEKEQYIEKYKFFAEEVRDIRKSLINL